MGEVFAVHDTTRDTMVALNLVTLHELMASEGGREWYLTMDRVDGVDVVSFVRHGAVAPAAIADAAPEALLRAAMGMAEAADMGP